ncbi:MAG: hypothetical protein N838_05840 [Thiohalocapsa sp. PB-PSB1]|nr:MAG: hypothetical protein N838_05840 [Thiohalocapsa sp. PB-PSB1]
MKTAQETTRQAKTAIEASRQKIEKLEDTIDEERQKREAADKALADLRVQLAAATERASHTDDLRQLLAGLQQAAPAEGEG